MTDITDSEFEAEQRDLRIHNAFQRERNGDKFRNVYEFLLAYDYFKAGYEAGAELARQDEREACAQRIRALIESHCLDTQRSDDTRDHCHPEPGSCEIVDAWFTAIDVVRGQTEIVLRARGSDK